MIESGQARIIELRCATRGIYYVHDKKRDEIYV